MAAADPRSEPAGALPAHWWLRRDAAPTMAMTKHHVLYEDDSVIVYIDRYPVPVVESKIPGAALRFVGTPAFWDVLRLFDQYQTRPKD